MHDDIIFELRAFPKHGSPIKDHMGTRVTITGDVFDRYLAPKPRDHDLPDFMRGFANPQFDALRTEQERRQIAAEIAQRLTDAILTMIKARDPIKGYSPEDWAKLNRVDQPPESA